jgi:NCAIR mutase (PurE)-related protein
VGYGAHLKGITAFLGMLNSCAPGITVVNIDNGFGAAYSVHRIALTSITSDFISQSRSAQA